ncbi:hypothetical protein MVEN_02392200 [Mycena venus]|uniref:GATA-type domain-containing protein n=1 Tax=Mycena venus TaxID=2733690 RepID=A0A8H6X272_9AGAR|nr:hypothetical protein MVEN_02392200 [Mycena venus]
MSTSAHLAALLAGALADVESLREELAGVKKRAERAERLLATFGAVAATLTGGTVSKTVEGSEKEKEKEKDKEGESAGDAGTSPPAPGTTTSPPAPPTESPSAPTTTLPGTTHPPSASSSSSSIPATNTTTTTSTVPHLPPRDDRAPPHARRAHRARRAAPRRRALARLAAIQSNWAQLSAYLGVVEARAADARSGFGRIVSEGGGGGRLVLVDVPMPATAQGVGLGGAGRLAGGGGGYYGMPPPPASHHASDAARSSSSRKSTRDTFGTLPLPPIPAPGGSGTRRPREASMDMYARGDYKRPRVGDGDYDYHHPTQYYPSLPRALPILPPRRRRRRCILLLPHPARHLVPAPLARPPADARVLAPRPRARARARPPALARPLAEHGVGRPRRAAARERERLAARRGRGAAPRAPGVALAGVEPRGGEWRWGAGAGAGGGAHAHGRPERERERERERGATLDVPHVHGEPYAVEGGGASIRGVRAGTEGAGMAGGSEPSVFAPPVPQAGPQKKGTKDLHAFPYPAGQGPSSSAPSSSGAPASAAANALPGTGTPFPPTNAANQRICRQCGLPGRYKEGKCVEKWGPGPLGPGTVCDRCRKKMKRVERRGTLEAQTQGMQAAAANPAAAAAGGYSSRSNTVHRTDTLPAAAAGAAAVGAGAGAAAGSAYREREQAPQESSIRSSLAAPVAVPAVAAAVATPSAGRVIKNRLTPVPAVPSAATAPPSLLPPLRTHSPMEVDGEDEGDSLDADAEAEVDEDVAGAAGVYAAHALPHAPYAGEQDADGGGRRGGGRGGRWGPRGGSAGGGGCGGEGDGREWRGEGEGEERGLVDDDDDDDAPPRPQRDDTPTPL